MDLCVALPFKKKKKKVNSTPTLQYSNTYTTNQKNISSNNYTSAKMSGVVGDEKILVSHAYYPSLKILET